MCSNFGYFWIELNKHFELYFKLFSTGVTEILNIDVDVKKKARHHKVQLLPHYSCKKEAG